VAAYPADDKKYSYQWNIEGGKAEATEGAKLRLTTGNGAKTTLRCVAIDRATGTMEAATADIRLEDPLPPPQVELSDKIFPGQLRTARVTNLPGPEVAIQWDLTGLEDAAPGATPKGQCQFRALAAGPARLTCTFTHPHTGETVQWSRALNVAAAQPLLAPAQIRTFTCDPPSPLKADTKTARLQWTLDKAPEAQVLREEFTGRTWRLDPADRAFLLPTPLHGRQRFTLTTTVKDLNRDEDSSASRRVEVVVPGVSVLAGDVEHLGFSYMRDFLKGATPWGSVTGMAWKAPYLYFSQGDQHTIRRVALTGGPVEEVAGLRGQPGTGKAGRNLLFEPGQLVVRKAMGKGGADEWLVLQPGANCIQSFTEGEAAATMKVLAGSFTRVAVPGDKELKAPAAMAVHAGTGQVFVADRGNRAIKMFAPDGSAVQLLATGFEASGIAVNEHGDVFFSDSTQHVIGLLRHTGNQLTMASTFAKVEVFAGSPGKPGAVDGKRASEARFRQPMGLTLDTADAPYLVVADAGNHLVRRIPADLKNQGEVETIGGNPHLIKADSEHMAVHPSGIVALADAASQEIRLYAANGQAVHTVAASRGFQARSVALDQDGNLFFSDPGHRVVRVMRLNNPPLSMNPDYGVPELFAGTLDVAGRAEGKRSLAQFNRPEGLALDSRDPSFLLITDGPNQVVWKVAMDLTQDLPVTNVGKPVVAEAGVCNDGFLDGTQGDAKFSDPRQVCGDGHGRIFVQDQAGSGQAPVLREIDGAGMVTTLGGIHLDTTARDRTDGTGSGAGFHRPMGLTVDEDGVVYVGDHGNRCLRRIGPEGQVTVAAGSRVDADRSHRDQGPAGSARFDSMGFVGRDGEGRIAILEPRAQRLRLLDFKKGDDPQTPGEVTEVKGQLLSTLVSNFPADAGLDRNYVFIVAELKGKDGDHELKVIRNPNPAGETVDPKVKLQALCADRANRIWAVLPPDPARPGKLLIHRYSYPEPRPDSLWDKEVATFDLRTVAAGRSVAVESPRLDNKHAGADTKHAKEPAAAVGPALDSKDAADNRASTPCAEPRITAMATDSHHNLYMADADNGLIWKVGADLRTLTQVAGAYPYLGPIGREWHDPLMAMQGLAVTPDDDLVLTCGNAVLRLTQMGPEPRPWTRCNVRLYSAPVVRKAQAAGAKACATVLQNEKKEQVWRMALNSSQKGLLEASEALQKAKASTRQAEDAAQADRSSLPLKNRAKALGTMLGQAQRALDLAQAKAEAHRAGYACLLQLDPYLLTDDDAIAKLETHEPALARAKALGLARQAQYEFLKTLKEREALLAVSPRRAQLDVRLDFLKQFAEARLAEADRSQGAQALRALKLTDPAHPAAKASLSQADDVCKHALAGLVKAEQAARAFDKAHHGETTSVFTPWTLITSNPEI